MKLSGTITKVSGPLVVANGLADANVSDVVRVGEQRLIGEILNMTGDTICFSPKYKTVSGRKSLISAGKPEFPVPGRLPERFFALQILFPAGFARFFWKKALQTNRKKLLYLYAPSA